MDRLGTSHMDLLLTKNNWEGDHDQLQNQGHLADYSEDTTWIIDMKYNIITMRPRCLRCIRYRNFTVHLTSFD